MHIVAMSIFKAYDIRGIYGEQWDSGVAYRIGYFLPALLKAKEIVVGQDARVSSDEVFAALSRGITEAGCNVVDIGLCSTPSLYFTTAYYQFDGSVMITASHNPPDYNGLKISKSQARPVGFDTGLKDLEESLSRPITPAAAKGTIRKQDIRRDYLAHLKPYARGIGPVKAVIDCSDGMASVFIQDVIRELEAEIVTMYDRPDGRFPHHPPNPLEEKNLADLKKRTLKEQAEIGICFDGDADRVMFIDELGRFVSPDLIIALLGYHFFRYSDAAEKGAIVSYDVRSSRSVVDTVRELGGTPVICRVGHSHAKKLLREKNGLYGGELAGHYYFRDNYFCDSGMIAALLVLAVLSRLKEEGVPFSEMIARIKQYAFSGEINFVVKEKDRIIAGILEAYQALPGAELTEIDGIRLDFPTWWFNLRKSNTEPYLRLVVEAETEKELKARTDELAKRIKEN